MVRSKTGAFKKIPIENGGKIVKMWAAHEGKGEKKKRKKGESASPAVVSENLGSQ